MKIYRPMNMDHVVDIAKALQIMGETVRKMGGMIDPDITIMSQDIVEEGELAPTVSIKMTFIPSLVHEYIAQLTPQEGCNG